METYPKQTPLTCPACSKAVWRTDIKAGRCHTCNVDICVPKKYYRLPNFISVAVTIVFIVATFSTFFTSPANFALVMFWLLLILAVRSGSIFFTALFLHLFYPPVIERLYANDVIITLRLSD